MEKFILPIHPVRCVESGPSECVKTVFLTNLILNKNDECEKIYIFSPSLYQDLHQKLIKCFSKYIPINIIPDTFQEYHIDPIIDEIFNDEDFIKSETEIESFETTD